MFTISQASWLKKKVSYKNVRKEATCVCSCIVLIVAFRPVGGKLTLYLTTSTSTTTDTTTIKVLIKLET